jgi:hypothetical protein
MILMDKMLEKKRLLGLEGTFPGKSYLKLALMGHRPGIAP